MLSSLHFSANRFLNLFFCCFFALNLQAQIATTHFSARQSGWWTLGLNAGTAYQSSDVCIDPGGWGAGLTLGKNLFYKPGAPVSFDLRGRFLFSKTYGADAVRSFGIAKNDVLNGQNDAGLNYLLDKSAPNDSSFVFQNYKNSAGELALEGVLTFNKLRERTGVVFSVFGGVGLDVYNVWTDQTDGSGNRYNYLNINPNGNTRSINADLETLRDGNHETNAEGFKNGDPKIGFMPDLGVELGYQIAPRFYLGLGHKVTFTRTDLFDGQRWNNDNTATGENDLHHYTNFFMRWDIQPTHREKRAKPPTIEITYPQTDPYISSSRDCEVLANIKNVRGTGDVICTVNGSNQRFDFRSEKFRTNILLQNGRNEVKIRASNPDGRAEATTVIVFEEKYYPPTPPVPPPPVPTRPTVDFVQPGRTPFTTDRDQTFVIARVTGIRDRREVRMFVNGFENTNFSMAENVEATVNLREGRNIVRVEAQSPNGQASDEVEIFFEKTIVVPEIPEVNITNPSRKAEATKEKTFPFRATVKNVGSRGQIFMTLNGSRFDDFLFNYRNNEVSATLPIQSGDNTVNIRVENHSGSDEQSATITFVGGIHFPKKPSVEIFAPANNSTTNQPTTELKANLTHISESNQITVLVNGSQIYNFNFDKINQNLAAAVGLREGDNTLTIKVVNADGRDEETVRVRFEKVKNPPMVDITAPSNNSKTEQATTDFRANLKNVSEANQITILANGSLISNFNFDKKNQTVSATVGLREGDNTLTIKVVNADGSDEETVKVKFEKAKKLPVVNITAPADKSSTDVEKCVLTATVANVFDQKNIEIRVGRRSITNFSLDRAGNILASFTLEPGKNNITIRATNADGSDQKTVEVSLNPKMVSAKPDIKFTNPKSPGLEVNDKNFTVRAQISRVTDKKQMVVKINGNLTRSYDFDPKTGELTARATLVEGSNSVVVEATNEGGKSEAQTSILLKTNAINVPEVKIISASAPTVNPDDPTVFRSSVVAETKNVTDRSQVKVKVRGVDFTDFEFNATKNYVKFVIRLQPGDNPVEIIVNTPQGTDSDKTVVKL